MRVPPHCPQALIHRELKVSPAGASVLGAELLGQLLPAVFLGCAHLPWPGWCRGGFSSRAVAVS